MKILYIFIVTLFIFKINTYAQIYGYWNEQFETMPINQSPTGDWLSTGSFSVLPAPHGILYGTNTNGLSCNLNATHLSDSIFLPKTTGLSYANSFFLPKVRICNWAGGVPISETILVAGDTCYFSIYKYSGSTIIDKKIIKKIHSGNYGAGFTYPEIFTMLYWLDATDVFRLVIHITRGPSGDYWYDFDNLGFYPNVSSIYENKESLLIHTYPNPIKTILNIKTNEPIKELSIFNISGEIVYHETAHTSPLNFSNGISLKDFSQGIYYLLIQTPNGTLKEKFIKE